MNTFELYKKHSNNHGIRVYRPNEKEYKVLSLFMSYFNDIARANKSQYRAIVSITYFDYGQDWQYTCILAEDYNQELNSLTRSWQALCPRDYETLIATDSIDKVAEMAQIYYDSLYNKVNGVLFKQQVPRGLKCSPRFYSLN